jgi:hypothetical protein
MLQTTEVVPQHEAVHYTWEHDVTGQKFNESVLVIETLPQFANHWFDSIYGGYVVEFKDDDGNPHEVTTEDGVKGMGYRGVIAFDAEGKAVNYL